MRFYDTLTAPILRQIRTYDPVTGILYDRRGEPSGFKHESAPGRWYVRVNLGRYGQHYVHRLAFLWQEGKFPPKYVDHIDGDGLNNAWSNLRHATPSQNMWNVPVAAGHSTGVRGVRFDRFRQKYCFEMQCPDGTRLFRRYDSFAAAVAARLEAERTFWVW